eukprot:NODE_600_length_5523_cov_0.389749.p3 type:complete len:195 gc:universal NODE_600_length_5523_cov_0.389749:2436-3020(+)
MNLIDKILTDHKDIKSYRDQFLSNLEINPTFKEKVEDKWFNMLVWELARHYVAIEIAVYPLLESYGPEGQELASLGRAAHHQLKRDLDQIHDKADCSKISKVMDDLMDQMKVEETKDIPYLKENLTEDELIAAGKAFDFRKKIAPTRIHSFIPNHSPSLETALGLFVSPIDKFRDLFLDFPDNFEIKHASDGMK